MVVNYSVRRASVGDRFKERAETKLEKFNRFFKDPTAFITVTQERDRFTVEITIETIDMVYRAERTTTDMFASLDEAIDTIFRQINKNKSRLEKQLRKDAFDETFDAESFLLSSDENQDDQTEEEFKIVRSKRFEVKPTTIEEAVLQMNMLGHEFFLFRNGESDEINLVYKRKDGDYGLIEPEE